MRKLVRLVVGCGLMSALGACGHSMTLRPLDGGSPAVGASYNGKAPIEIRVDGKVYRGLWRETDTIEAGPGLMTVPNSGPITVGRFYGQRGAGGGGVADLVAKDGATISCRFRHEFGQEHGSGLCRSDQGRTFSLRVD